MLVDYTLRRFPLTGRLKNECGLPFACVVQPFAEPDQSGIGNSPPGSVKAEELARCSSCYAYVNKHCDFQPDGWTCALCGQFNEYSSLRARRYARLQGRRQLPELQGNFVEVQCALDDDLDTLQGDEEQVRTFELEAQPLCLALVDLSCNEECLELVKSGLSAALEALPPAARFGLLTFSNKVGLFDAQGQVPSVRYVHLIEGEADSPTLLDLQDALPLDSLLAPVVSCKDTITAAIDLLQPDRPPAEAATLEIADGGRRNPRRGFGGALQAVLRYLGSGVSNLETSISEARKEHPSTLGGSHGTASAGARLMAFLAGPPDFGRGATARLSEASSKSQQKPAGTDPHLRLLSGGDGFEDLVPASNHKTEQNGHLQQPAGMWVEAAKSAAAFYEEAAVAASSLGVCVDLYALSPLYCGLDLMEPLASSSGGILRLYPSIDSAALPQDVYRRLACPYALTGLLRIRTSPEFRVARAFGQLFLDERYENLAHVVACDPSTTFAFDFEYANTAGFSDAPDNPPMLQIAFQYRVVVPAKTYKAAEQNGSRDGGHPTCQRFVIQKRMRILTTPARVARSMSEVYADVNADAVLTMLMHKIGRAADGEGPQEARNLLQDWLVLFSARVNSYAAKADKKGSLVGPSQVDVTFDDLSMLQPLPRLVYALLRSPLLALGQRAHPDLRAVVHHLWASLPPDLLRCATYPVLTSFTDPDTQARSQHALSRAAFISAGAPIFLLDSFTELIVYYVVGFPRHLPFPPPPQSLLRRTITSLRQRRRPTPSLKMLRGGVDDGQPFLACLVEEPELDDYATRVVTPGFADFLEDIRCEVWSFMSRSSK